MQKLHRAFTLTLTLVLQMTAQAAPLYEESYISPPGTFPANHGSTLTELPDGQLLSCWYAGSREMGEDVQIYCGRKAKRDSQWSAPEVVVARQERAEWAWLSNKTLGNPVLYLDSEQSLWLFFTSVSLGGWAGGQVDYKVSRDLGKTWSPSRRLEEGLGHLTRIKPLTLNDGSFLLPLYYELLTKQGYTCRLRAHNGEIVEKTCASIPGEKHLQPALAKNGDTVLAFLRSENGKILEARFDSVSGTWGTPVATGLPNPDASIDAISAPDGRVMLVFNNSASSRSPLSLAMSNSKGGFNPIWEFEKFGLDKEYSYPAIIRLSDGSYLLSYTYDHRSGIKSVHFNEEWLEMRKVFEDTLCYNSLQ